MSSDKVYIAIDLKSFYASVECIEQVYLKHVAPEDIHADPIVTITYFVSDKKKEGGAYVDVTGIVKEIDEYERCIVMTDKKKIPIEQVRAIEGDLFKCLEL